MICDELALSVARFDGRRGLSEGPLLKLKDLRPDVRAKMRVKSIRFEKRPFIEENYEANGTLVVTMEYDEVQSEFRNLS